MKSAYIRASSSLPIRIRQRRNILAECRLARHYPVRVRLSQTLAIRRLNVQTSVDFVESSHGERPFATKATVVTGFSLSS